MNLIQNVTENVSRGGNKGENQNLKYDGDEIIQLNVGGEYFETYVNTIRKYPDSLLGRYINSNFFDINKVHFFDRNYEAFSKILDFLRTGILIKPYNIPEIFFQEELSYWGYPCYNQGYELESLINNMVLESDVIKQNNNKNTTPQNRLKWSLQEIIKRKGELISLLNAFNDLSIGDKKNDTTYELASELKQSYLEELEYSNLKILQIEILSVYRELESIIINPKFFRTKESKKKFELFLEKLYQKVEFKEEIKEDNYISYKSEEVLLLKNKRYSNDVLWSIFNISKYCRYHDKSNLNKVEIPICQNCMYKYSYYKYSVYLNVKPSENSPPISIIKKSCR